MWESILWFLIFGGAFYLMMRMGGCGMHTHGVHGNHKNNGKSNKTIDVETMVVKDPVCGMDVNVNKAYASMEYKNKTYYFCSQKCHDTFMQDPALYSKG